MGLIAPRGEIGSFRRRVAGFEVALFPHGHGIGAAQAGRTGSLKPERPLSGFVRSKWRVWVVPAAGVRQWRGSGWLCSLSAEGFRLSGWSLAGSLHSGRPQKWVCSLKMAGLGFTGTRDRVVRKFRMGLFAQNRRRLGAAVEMGLFSHRGRIRGIAGGHTHCAMGSFRQGQRKHRSGRRSGSPCDERERAWDWAAVRFSNSDGQWPPTGMKIDWRGCTIVARQTKQ